MPLAGDALQLVLASVFEHQPRARGEVFDRGADQHLPRAGERANPGADVDRHTAARSMPASSMTVMMSSITTSKGGRSWGESRSDRPTPRRSKMATRANEPSPVSILLKSGSSQFQYRLEMNPGIHTRSAGP